MRFSKNKRLLTPADYKAVFDDVQLKVNSHSFLLLSRPNQLAHARIGIIVAKKHVAQANRRNQIKRQIRETFRVSSGLPPLDIVILVRHKLAKQENTQIKEDLMVLWRRLKKRCGQQTPSS